MIRYITVVLSVCAIIGFGFSASANICCQLRDPTIEVHTQIIAAFDRPWGFGFLPDGSVLVTELAGRLRRVQDGQVSKPIAFVPKVEKIGQGGLLDIAIDPDFENNNLIFFTFTQAEESGFGTAVARARLDMAHHRLDDVKIIFSSNIKSSGGRHFGARIQVAPDDTLYITLGDRGTQRRAQNRFDHAGSVIRINKDGSIPQDNPFADGEQALPEIYSIGHRNPQGATFHPVTGDYWTLSHGPSGGDELNRPQPGRNYGWPLISYGANYSGAPFEKGSEAEGLEQPVYYWDPAIAPSGLSFYVVEEPLIPEWQGSLFLGALRGQHLTRLVFEGDKIVAEERYFEAEFGRIRDVRTGPDGALWLLCDGPDGQLVRVTAG